MTTTANGLALRDDRAIVNVPAGALAIEAGQTAWTTMQAAALGQLGIADAPEGDKQVFLHVYQRTGLDPFAKQIYMIPRWDYQAKKNKWSIQTGIEGFRVIRGRAERAEGVRGILSRPLFYDAEGNEYKAWLSRGVPVAVEMTYTVRDRNGIETPYTSILRFDEYRQTRKDGDQTVLSGQWAVKPTHMLEKCTEADVYRKAFPQDYSGVDLDDAMPEPDPDAVTAYQRQAPPVADLKARAAAHTVTATVVTPEPSPAAAGVSPPPAEDPRTADAAPQQAAGEHLKTGPEYIAERLEKLGVTGVVRTAGRLAGRHLTSLDDLTDTEAVTVMRTLSTCKTAADLDGVLAELEMAGDPRGETGDGNG